MLIQIIGIVIIYMWVFAILLFKKKNYLGNKEEGTQDNRDVLSPDAALTLFILGLVGVKTIKSAFNITFDFLNIELTQQILWALIPTILISSMLTKNKNLQTILLYFCGMIAIAFSILP